MTIWVHFFTFTNVQLEPVGTGSSEQLVLQAYNGSHGDVHLASGAAPAFWRISGASPLHLWRISGTAVVHIWHISGAVPALW